LIYLHASVQCDIVQSSAIQSMHQFLPHSIRYPSVLEIHSQQTRYFLHQTHQALVCDLPAHRQVYVLQLSHLHPQKLQKLIVDFQRTQLQFPKVLYLVQHYRQKLRPNLRTLICHLNQSLLMFRLDNFYKLCNMASNELLDIYEHPEMCNSSRPVKSLKLLIETSEILFNSHK
jgi:hypothetical protein